MICSAGAWEFVDGRGIIYHPSAGSLGLSSSYTRLARQVHFTRNWRRRERRVLLLIAVCLPSHLSPALLCAAVQLTRRFRRALQPCLPQRSVARSAALHPQLQGGAAATPEIPRCLRAAQRPPVLRISSSLKRLRLPREAPRERPGTFDCKPRRQTPPSFSALRPRMAQGQGRQTVLAPPTTTRMMVVRHPKPVG